MDLYLGGVHSKQVLQGYQAAGVERIELDWYATCRQMGEAALEYLEGLLDAGWQVGVVAGLHSVVQAEQLRGLSTFAERYIAQVLPLADRLVYVTDFDLHPAYSQKVIYQRREEVLEAMPEASLDRLWPIMSEPWNPESDAEYDTWARFCIPGYKAPEDVRAVINRFRPATVHLIGVTDMNAAVGLPVRTASTNLGAFGAKYGAVYDYAGGLRLRRLFDGNVSEVKRRLIKERLRDRVDALNIPWDDFFQESIDAITWWNAHQLLQLDADLKNRSKALEYWREDEYAETTSLVVAPPAQTELARRNVKRDELSQFYQDPKLTTVRKCDSCQLRRQCPAFKAGSDCTIDDLPILLNETDVDDAHKALIALQMRRVAMAVHKENLDGVADDEVSAMMAQTNRMLTDYRKANQADISISAKGAGVGILSQIFGYAGSGPNGGSDAATRASRSAAKRQALADSIKGEGAEVIDAEYIDMGKDGD